MKNEWCTYRIEELCDFINGFAFKSGDYIKSSEDTIEVFRMGYIQRAGGFKEDNTPVFIPRNYYKSIEKYFLQPGDIAIAMTDMKDRMAILGNTALIRDSDRFVLNQRVGNLRVRRHDILDSRFFYFYSNWEPHVNWLRSMANSGVQVNLGTTAIKEAEITIPSIKKQKAIAHILGTLDDKIELNRQMNATLEAMAQALFKSWFVDFDPVIDNALAAGNPIPEPLLARAEIRKALGDQRKPLPDNLQQEFPDRFILTDEMGWIPDGWLFDKLSSQIDVLNGFAFKSADYCEKGTFVLRTKNFNSSSMIELLSDDVYLPDSFLHSHAKYLCEGYDYHLIMVGASVGNRGLILPHQLPALRNQNMWCFRPNEASITSKSFTKYLLDSIISEKMNLASGSAREFFRKGDFQNHFVLFGSKHIQDSFSKFCFVMMNKIAQNSAQSDKLAQTRDTLLPKLLSGEIRVPDVEAIIEEQLAGA